MHYTDFRDLRLSVIRWKWHRFVYSPNVYTIMKELLGNNWHFIYVQSEYCRSPCLQGQGIKFYDQCLFIFGKHGCIFLVLLNLICNHIYRSYILNIIHVYITMHLLLYEYLDWMIQYPVSDTGDWIIQSNEYHAWFHLYGLRLAVRNGK